MMFDFGELVKLTDKELQVLWKEAEQKDLVGWRGPSSMKVARPPLPFFG